MAIDGIVLEQTILGHALNHTECYNEFVSQVKWQSFAATNHKVIAFCILQMASLGIAQPDEDSFQLVVGSYPSNDKDYGGVNYIRQLKEAYTEPTDNYDKFLERLAVAYIKRTVATEHINRLIRISNDPATSLADVASVIESINNDIEQHNTVDFKFADMHEVGAKYLSELESRRVRPFFTTGFDRLDAQLTEGFLPKHITVMAGFTGMAKSTVAINMAHRVAVDGFCTAVFSMEMTDVSLYDKMVSTLTQVPLVKLKRDVKELTNEESARITGAVDSLARLPILINDEPLISIDSINHQLLLAKRKGYDPRVVFIDLFGKVDDVDTGGENMAQRIQREMKRMRVLAKRLDVHFVLVVQIGRAGYGKRKQGVVRPTIIDIKNANAYAEEADIVLLLHRSKYYMPDIDDDILEVEIAKQRGGATNRVNFEFFPDTATIVDTDKVPQI